MGIFGWSLPPGCGALPGEEPYDDEDPELEELKAQARADRRYHRQLITHPDPRDPDYPGDRNDQESNL